jgi:hypothetical protein
MDSFTETTRTGWFSRIGNSFKGILFGLALFAGSFVLIYWNEARAIDRTKALEEGEGVVVSVPADRADPANNAALIHIQGLVETAEGVRDSLFGAQYPEALRLQRYVEMYQWTEDEDRETTSNAGGSETTRTTYTYTKEWSSSYHNSSEFKRPSGHENPPMKLRSDDFVAPDAHLGAFQLSAGQVNKIGRPKMQPLESLEQAPKAAAAGFTVQAGKLYKGNSSGAPEIGDYRVEFRTVPETDASIVAAQNNTALEPYATKTGELELVETGLLSAEAMFTKAHQKNAMMTWILRFVGWFVMFLGISMILKPIVVFADVLPILGNIAGAGVGLIAGLLSLSLSLVTIAISWIVVRPLLGVGLLVVAIAAAALIFMFRNRKDPETLAAHRAQ